MVAQQTLTLFVWVQILVPLPKSLGLKEPRLFFEVWLSLVERYVRDVEAAGSNPVTSTTSRRGLVPRRIFLRKMRLRRTACRSSPQKVTLRLRCSLINALTTLRLATNFLRKRSSLFKTLRPIRDHRLGGDRELFCPRRHSIYFVTPTQKSADTAKCLPIFTSSLFTLPSSLHCSAHPLVSPAGSVGSRQRRPEGGVAAATVKRSARAKVDTTWW